MIIETVGPGAEDPEFESCSPTDGEGDHRSSYQVPQLQILYFQNDFKKYTAGFIDWARGIC